MSEQMTSKPGDYFVPPDGLVSITKALTQLLEQMTLTNQFLAQVVAHNADMLDAGGEAKDDGPETLTSRVGSVGTGTRSRK